jgi:hypothetical protein
VITIVVMQRMPCCWLTNGMQYVLAELGSVPSVPEFSTRVIIKTGTHSVGDASEIKSLGHAPVLHQQYRHFREHCNDDLRGLLCRFERTDRVRSSRGKRAEEDRRVTYELQASHGKPSFAQRYTDFMAAAANHIKVIAPFIPALTEMLHHVLK